MSNTLEQQKKKLIEKLIFQDIIKTDKVKKAMLQTPRELFISENQKNQAYLDTPLQIENNQTISAPHMVAIMAEALDLKPSQKVLEVGAGSGYHAAVTSKIIGEKGVVYSIERHKELAERAIKNIKNADIKNIKIIIGDGSEGLAKYAPYNRIYVTCASPEIPKPLIKQLKDPGKILIPVGYTYCDLILFEKKQGKVIEKNLGACAFVPLIGKYGH